MSGDTVPASVALRVVRCTGNRTFPHIHIGKVDVPVIVRLQGLHKTAALARGLLPPIGQKSLGFEHPVNAGRTDRHDVPVQHHKAQPPVALQRILIEELHDRLLFPRFQPVSEFEIGILRQRAREAYRQKVQRGEVLTLVPISYERRGAEGIEMTPDRQVQEAVRSLLQRFEAMGTLRQALLWHHQEQITFSRRRRLHGVATIEWRLPDDQQLLRVLKNPTYAGAFAYGKSRSQTKIVGGRSRKSYGRRVSLDQWQVLIKDHHEGYITWERYLKNLERLQANTTKAHGAHAGAPRTGSAMLSGLLRCAKCGLQLSVGYRGGQGHNGRYQCLTGTREQGRPFCQSFAAFRVDQAVEAEVLKACKRFGVDASMQALAEKRSCCWAPICGCCRMIRKRHWTSRSES